MLFVSEFIWPMTDDFKDYSVLRDMINLNCFLSCYCDSHVDNWQLACTCTALYLVLRTPTSFTLHSVIHTLLRVN